MYKVVGLQCSWIKRLHDNNSHNWKIISLHMTTHKSGKKFLFHSNLDVSSKQINHFPQYYLEIFRKWSSNLSVSPNIPSKITSQVIWFNKNIKIVANPYAIIVQHIKVLTMQDNFLMKTVWQKPGFILKHNSISVTSNNIFGFS